MHPGSDLCPTLTSAVVSGVYPRSAAPLTSFARIACPALWVVGPCPASGSGSFPPPTACGAPAAPLGASSRRWVPGSTTPPAMRETASCSTGAGETRTAANRTGARETGTHGRTRVRGVNLGADEAAPSQPIELGERRRLCTLWLPPAKDPLAGIRNGYGGPAAVAAAGAAQSATRSRSGGPQRYAEIGHAAQHGKGQS